MRPALQCRETMKFPFCKNGGQFECLISHPFLVSLHVAHHLLVFHSFIDDPTVGTQLTIPWWGRLFLWYRSMLREGLRFHKSGKQLLVILNNRSISAKCLLYKIIQEDHYAVHADRNYIILSYHVSVCYFIWDSVKVRVLFEAEFCFKRFMRSIV